MEELKDLTTVIRNLTRTRSFFLASNQSRKEKTAAALEVSIRKGMEQADALAYSEIHTIAGDGGVVSKDDSQDQADYAALRRDVLVVLDQVEPAPEAGSDS